MSKHFIIYKFSPITQYSQLKILDVFLLFLMYVTTKGVGTIKFLVYFCLDFSYASFICCHFIWQRMSDGLCTSLFYVIIAANDVQPKILT